MEADCSAIFQTFQLYIQSGADHSPLVLPVREVHNSFPGSVLLCGFKSVKVTVCHHSEKPDGDL